MESAHFSQLAYPQMRVFPECRHGVHYTVVIHILAEILPGVVIYGPGHIDFVGIQHIRHLAYSNFVIQIRLSAVKQLGDSSEQDIGRALSCHGSLPSGFHDRIPADRHCASLPFPEIHYP